MASHRIELAGCAPEPLMSYLKALGVLRLVSEQLDSNALGSWDRDVFVLESTVDEAGLEAFFLDRYQPTPILAPWNAGCGLYRNWDAKAQKFRERKAAEALERIEQSESPRLASYREELKRLKEALTEVATPVSIAEDIDRIRHRGAIEGWSRKQIEEEVKSHLNGLLFFEVNGREMAIRSEDKDELLRLLRNRVLSDSSLRWLDAAIVLTVGRKKNRLEAPLLGTGGNIGNSEFSARFAQVLSKAMPFGSGERIPKDSAQMLANSLWGARTSGLLTLKVDQFDPGRAGSFNMGQGIDEAPSLLNSWDYLLMVEGVLLMGGSGARRTQADTMASAFPFAVDSSPVGFASAAEEETRREIWLPRWDSPTTLSEIKWLLSEGRTQIGRRSARNGVEQAIAAATLSMDRGIRSFSRVQFQSRLGQNYLANNVGRFAVNPRGFGPVLEELQIWVGALRRGASMKGVPPRLLAAARAIEARIFRYCASGLEADLLAVLVATGAAERELSIAGGLDSQGNVICRPSPKLRGHWIAALDDGSPEFEIALAVAGVYSIPHPDPTKTPLSIRANLEPVKRAENEWTWDKKAPSAAWKNGGLLPNLTAVLGRRLLEGKAALAFTQGVRLSTIARFLADETDDRRIEDLIWALSLVEPAPIERPQDRDAPPLPREFALLKAMYLPWPVRYGRESRKWVYRHAGGEPIKLEPRILPLLRADRADEACVIARQRLLVSGMPPLLGLDELGKKVPADRLAAALLLPVRAEDLNEMLGLVCRPPALELQGEGD